MGAMASQITSLTIVYLTVSSGADQRKHQSSAPLAFVRGILRWPMNSPHKGPLTRGFDVSLDLPLNKRLSKQPRRRWFETHRSNYDVTVLDIRLQCLFDRQYLQIRDCYCSRFFRKPSGNWWIIDGRIENRPTLQSPQYIYFLSLLSHDWFHLMTSSWHIGLQVFTGAIHYGI